MSAIIEPEGATWHVGPTMWKSVSVVTNSEDRNVILRRDYPRVPGEEPLVESIELHLSDLPAIEAALLNARLWLERATKQAAELKAAEEVAEDAGEDCPCGHPLHDGWVCDVCDCDACFCICGHPRWAMHPRGDDCKADVMGATCSCARFIRRQP